MLNVQCLKLDEWSSNQCSYALDHCLIENSLKIDNCKLLIAPTRRGAL